ncbi:MAG: Biotin synthase [Deltaproteobacteria bacterium ADurb.Bin510]|nr:MAG: Biotin synthase [Deltaproteobacteria bacterium ADurb.Bin510]
MPAALNPADLLALNDADLRSRAAALRRAHQPARTACAVVSAKAGHCSEDCSFCAQSRHHRAAVTRHALLSPAALLEKAQAAELAGARRFGLVTSGLRLSADEFAQVCVAVEMIRAATGLKVCASLGLLNEARAARLRAAGLSRYHHNLETAASFFAQVCTTHRYEQNLATVRSARAAGLETCCGGIFGLGESWAQRLELGLSLNELGIDAIPVNFLNPRPGTPLAGRSLLPPPEALRIIALMRGLNPTCELIVAGGRPQVLGARQAEVFDWGASAIMIGDYLTTPGADLSFDRRLLGLAD